MKRLLLVLALLWATEAQAFDRANWFSTRGVRAFGKALTDGGIFGAPRHTTALLPTCNTANTGGFAFDTTLGVHVFCDGTAWAAGGGVAAGDNVDWTGTHSFIDGNFSIIGSADPTKIAKFEVDGFTTATTRTFTLPNSSGTIPLLALAQTWTQAQTFGNGTNILLGSTTGTQGMQAAAGQTPDTVVFFTGTTSNAWQIYEVGDAGFDFNNGPCLAAACINPHLNIHDSDQNVTDYSSLSVGGVAGKMVKTLTEGAATDIAKVTIAAEEGTAGMLLVSVYATDGATPQVRHIRVNFAATNDGGVTTCTLEATPMEIDHTPTGTLTATVTCVDGTAAALLQVNATSSLVQTSLESRSQIILSGSGQIVPQ